MEQSYYDYVIVGAGSAGCVLAHRLSEHSDLSVLVIEAGGSDRTPNVWIPVAISKLFRTARDWNLSTEPEPHLHRRSLYMPRGKMLGGSSSMNAMIYIRGRRGDYDGWRDQGCTGWGYQDVLPLFMKSEHNERGGDAYHGTGGPLNVADGRSKRPASEYFVASAEAAGIAYNHDFNGAEQYGAGFYQLTQRNGRRWSTADGFLRPAMKRKRVDVVTGATARRVVLESAGSGPRAVGVEYVTGNQVVLARAAREVLLCGGAINSPQLLMLSGIGDSDHLHAMGIEPQVELAGVGQNLQDHPFATLVWHSKRGPMLEEAESPRNVLEYLTRRRGPMASNIAECGAFVHSETGRQTSATAATSGRPDADIQYHFCPGYFVDHGFSQYRGDAFTLLAVLLTPESRGSVRLRSADPWAPPAILGQHLREQRDVDVLVRAIEIGREIVESTPFDSTRGDELRPGPVLKGREQIVEHLRHTAELLYHPAGTCRMGSDGEAVVDTHLRVRGVDGLRVVDASIMPKIVGGNTNAPTIMIAEKAAESILTAQ